MTKVFLVNDTDAEGVAFHAASTYAKARRWIKKAQLENINDHKKRGWNQRQLQGFIEHYKNPNELHPYDIQEMELDKEE